MMQEPNHGLGSESRRQFRTRYRSREAASPHLWQIPAVRELLLLILVALSLWLLYSLRGIFLPLFIALVLAHIFNPLVTLIEEKWRWPRPLTVALLLAVFMISLAGLMAWLGPLLLEQATNLAYNLPDYLRTLATRFDIDLGDLLGQFEQSIRQFQLEPRQIIAHVFKTTSRAFGVVTTVFSVATYLTLSVALVLVYFFFFAWHFNSGVEKLKQYVPVSRRGRTFEIVSRMDEAVGQFFRGRLVICIIMGVMLSAGWFLADVPYWFFLGMLTGLLNIVPYLSFIGWPVAILLKYVEAVSGGQSAELLPVVLWPSVVYVGIQLLEGWFLTPWIQSGQTNLSAATVLLVVIIGGAVAGILGMLFAIPLTACIKILLVELLVPPIRRWAATH